MPNGYIYFVPFQTNNIGVFNPATKSFRTVGISVSGKNKYVGGVLGANGLTYFSPRDAANVSVFDPSTEIFSIDDSVSGRSEAYHRAVVGPDGNV